MNLTKLQSKLVDAARKEPPKDHVPYAFEKRIMACLGSVKPLNVWALWGRPLWGAALSCLAITLLCGLWALATMRNADSSDNFAQAFEKAVIASVDHSEDVW